MYGSYSFTCKRHHTCLYLVFTKPPVLVQQRPGLLGRRLSARRRRPCQTTAFCRHSNTRCQSLVLETGPLSPQDHNSGTVCRPISDYVGCHTASSGGYWRHFYSDSEATAQCELFLTAQNRNILTYFTYLFT